MGLIQYREGAHHQPEDMRKNLQTLESGRPSIFEDAKRARLEAFVTRDARTRRLGWEAIRQERVILVPSGKLCMRWDITRGFRERCLMSTPRIRSGWPVVKHVAIEEWKRVIWTSPPLDNRI